MRCGAKMWYFDSELVMDGFWAEHKWNQSKCCLQFPFQPRCARTWHILQSGTGLGWGTVCDPLLLDTLPCYFAITCSINNSVWLSMKQYTDIKLRRRKSVAASLCVCAILSLWIGWEVSSSWTITGGGSNHVVFVVNTNQTGTVWLNNIWNFQPPA